MRHSTSLLSAVWAGLFAVSLISACSPVVKSTGYKPSVEQVAKLKPGTHDRDDVAGILGSPSSISGFKPEIWLYIYKQTERIAFLAPDLKESQVLALHFDERGILGKVETLDMDDRRTVQPVARVTPTVGEEPGVVQQLLGNIGRFNKGDSKGPATPVGR